MEIKRNGSQPSQKGPGEYFTGTVRIDPIIQAPEPSRVTAGCVTFEPGARAAWDTPPPRCLVCCRPGAPDQPAGAQPPRPARAREPAPAPRASRAPPRTTAGPP